jgi:hypothetical protein
MNLPPLVARVRIEGKTPVNLPVPLFLLWIVSFLLLLPLLVLGLLVTALFAPRFEFFPLARGLYLALCASRGSEIELVSSRRHLSILLY